MAKSQAKISASEKLSLPGISINELLDYEDLFPMLRRNLAIIFIPAVAIAQIRVHFNTQKPTIVQTLPSVNCYMRTFLAKSDPLVYVTAAVSIRKTSAEYANDDTQDRLLSDHLSLSTDLSGPISTRDGLNAALGNSEKLRSYRRGIMAQVVGQIQSTVIHNPRRLCRDIENITLDTYLSRLPFETADLKLEEMLETINSLLSPTGETKLFVDYPSIDLASKKVPMESGFKIQRESVSLPDLTKIPADLSKLPKWKQASIRAAKNLEGGNK
jgi:hypothetical protein